MRASTARRIRAAILLYRQHRAVLTSIAFHVDPDVVLAIGRMLTDRARLRLGKDFRFYTIVQHRRAQSMARQFRRKK